MLVPKGGEKVESDAPAGTLEVTTKLVRMAVPGLTFESENENENTPGWAVHFTLILSN